MVKKRTPGANSGNSKRKEDIPAEKVEAFASQADSNSQINTNHPESPVAEKNLSVQGLSNSDAQDSSTKKLNPMAKRDFKAINLTLNEYEYRMLEVLSRRLNRTKLNVLRLALYDFDEKLTPDPSLVKSRNQ